MILPTKLQSPVSAKTYFYRYTLSSVLFVFSTYCPSESRNTPSLYLCYFSSLNQIFFVLCWAGLFHTLLMHVWDSWRSFNLIYFNLDFFISSSAWMTLWFGMQQSQFVSSFSVEWRTDYQVSRETTSIMYDFVNERLDKVRKCSNLRTWWFKIYCSAFLHEHQRCCW